MTATLAHRSLFEPLADQQPRYCDELRCLAVALLTTARTGLVWADALGLPGGEPPVFVEGIREANFVLENRVDEAARPTWDEDSDEFHVRYLARLTERTEATARRVLRGYEAAPEFAAYDLLMARASSLGAAAVANLR